MCPPGEAFVGVAECPSEDRPADREEQRDALSTHARLEAQVVRRDAEACVIALSGELWAGSVVSAAGAVSDALTEAGRVLVDLSGLRMTWTPAAQVFPSVLTAAGGWPAARLVLFGADADLSRSLTTLNVTHTVPLAVDETTARQVLLCRPPAIARTLDLGEEPSASRRARLFVKASCREWQIDAVCDDAVLVASELVGNAVTHARTACRLELRLDALGLTVAVRDYDFRGSLVPLACTSAGRRDHGLFLVASISRAWGVTPTEEGKNVWALLPVTTAAP
jgi:hypothetical protein